MSGIPDYNRPAFASAAIVLRRAGLTVFNPGELDEKVVNPFTWERCMKECIGELVRQDAIILLPHWESSKGARLEFNIAYELGIPIFHWEIVERHIKKLLNLEYGAIGGAMDFMI